MLRDDLFDVLERIPEFDLTKTVLQLRFNSAITVDVICRKEEDYLVVRGREAGTNDEGRLFFVPYEDVLYVKIDKVYKTADVKRMYGEKVTAEDEYDPFAQPEAAAAPAAAGAKPVDATPTPAAMNAHDPATIAKNNLLARIRAARTAAGVPSTNG